MLELVTERGFANTSVLDVCERADVGRSTFYTHFADKHELFFSGFAELASELRAGAPLGAFGFVPGLFEHVVAYASVHRAVGLAERRAIETRLHGVVLELVRAEVAGEGPRAEAVARFLAGALLELVWWCVDDGVAPAVAAEQFRALAAPIIDALG